MADGYAGTWQEVVNTLSRLKSTGLDTLGLQFGYVGLAILAGITIGEFLYEQYGDWAKTNIFDPAIDSLKYAEQHLRSVWTDASNTLRGLFDVLIIKLNATYANVISLWDTITNIVIPRIHTLEQWRRDCAAWLHNVIEQTLLEVRDIAVWCKNEINTTIARKFTDIYTTLASIPAQLKSLYDTLTSALSSAIAAVNASILNLSNRLTQTARSLTDLIAAKIADVTALIRSIETALKAEIVKLGEQIISLKAYITSEITRVIGLITDLDLSLTKELTDQKQDLDTPSEDWLMLAFLGITKSSIFDQMSTLEDVLTSHLQRIGK